MASPTFLGTIGSASDDSGAVTSLSFTVGTDVPFDPHNFVVFYIVASPTLSLPVQGADYSGFLSDNQPDPGGTGQPGNLYRAGEWGTGGDRVYAKGTPNSTITANNGAILVSGDMSADLAVAVSYWGFTPGTVVTLDLAGQTAAYLAIVGYAFSGVDVTDIALFVSGTINPANTETGLGALTPLSDVVFFDLPGIADDQVLAIVFTDSSHGSISDPSGNWTALDTDTSASTGATWATFLVDGSTVDVTQSVIQFTTSTSGTSILDSRVGADIYGLPLFVPLPGGPPAFNHRLSVGPNAGASGGASGDPAFQTRFPAGPNAGASGSPSADPAFAHRFRLAP